MSGKELVPEIIALKAEVAAQRERIQSEVADILEKYDRILVMLADELGDDADGDCK